MTGSNRPVAERVVVNGKNYWMALLDGKTYYAHFSPRAPMQWAKYKESVELLPKRGPRVIASAQLDSDGEELVARLAALSQGKLSAIIRKVRSVRSDPAAKAARVRETKLEKAAAILGMSKEEARTKLGW